MLVSDRWTRIERHLGIELELNPFSSSSRAARALHQGRTAEALRLLARSVDGERLISEHLTHGMPDWPTRDLLVSAARELVRLKRSATLARSAGVPEAITDSAAVCAEDTAITVWRMAERMGIAAAQRADSIRLDQALDRQRLTLERLLFAIQELQSELVEATLSPGADWGSLQSAEMHVRDVAEASRAVREWFDETTN